MIVSSAGLNVQELAQHLFDLLTRFSLLLPRGRRRSGELKEVEFLTLALLHRNGPRIVGEIQRQLGVLPAQMSRIIRALEARPQALIACRINPNDKRKIDVALTAEGLAAFQEHQQARVTAILAMLGRLSGDELDSLQRLVDKLRSEP